MCDANGHPTVSACHDSLQPSGEARVRSFPQIAHAQNAKNKDQRQGSAIESERQYKWLCCDQFFPLRACLGLRGRLLVLERQERDPTGTAHLGEQRIICEAAGGRCIISTYSTHTAFPMAYYLVRSPSQHSPPQQLSSEPSRGYTSRSRMLRLRGLQYLGYV